MNEAEMVEYVRIRDAQLAADLVALAVPRSDYPALFVDARLTTAEARTATDGLRRLGWVNVEIIGGTVEDFIGEIGQ